jgi:hypothetical protein
MPNHQHVLNVARAIAMGILLIHCTSVAAVDPDDYLGNQGHHPLFTGDAPPGVLGTARAMGRGPIQGYFQPVAFSGPRGTKFALPDNGAFAAAETKLMAGLLIGAVYRFQIIGIPGAEGAELYPTVELLDRTYPPAGLATRFPIPINLDQDDLDAALEGQMVTRVIYLEDPETAIPLPETPTTSRAIEISQFQDPLEVADRLGRPVAIVRIGSLVPPATQELMPQFYFGYPAWTPIFQPESDYASGQMPQP